MSLQPVCIFSPTGLYFFSPNFRVGITLFAHPVRTLKASSAWKELRPIIATMQHSRQPQQFHAVLTSGITVSVKGINLTPRVVEADGLLRSELEQHQVSLYLMEMWVISKQMQALLQDDTLRVRWWEHNLQASIILHDLHWVLLCLECHTRGTSFRLLSAPFPSGIQRACFRKHIRLQKHNGSLDSSFTLYLSSCCNKQLNANKDACFLSCSFKKTLGDNHRMPSHFGNISMTS